MEYVDFNKLPPPEYYKEFLLKIYRCKVPFELRYKKTKPKHYIGLYVEQPHSVDRKERVTNLLLKMVQFQEPMHSFSNALILVQTSSADAIGMEELDTIMNFIVGNLAKSASVKYGIGTRDYLNQRIRLLIG